MAPSYFRFRVPDVTWSEVNPLLDPQAVSSCVPVWFEKVAAVEPVPWSDPANEPVTLAVPPASGSVNPSLPELLAPA